MLAAHIDQTLLKPECTLEQIQALCEESLRHHFAGVCIPPRFVTAARGFLPKPGPALVTVIGFPFGYASSASKAEETRIAIRDGADEIDMVIPIGALKAHRDEEVLADIEAVCAAASGRTVKVIVETGALTEAEKKRAAEIVKRSPAHYIKTSTGFNGTGASVADVRLFREILGGTKKIKASGGIRTREFALQLIEAGAERIGTSSGPALVSGETIAEGTY